MDDINAVAPVYTESDEIVSFDDIITIQGRIKGDGNHVIPITPRQLISALRAGKVIRVIGHLTNGGDSGESIYAVSFSITSCVYMDGVLSFTCTLSTVTDGMYSAPTMDSYFETHFNSGQSGNDNDPTNPNTK